jgi:DNA-binding XRE family transcriptional regulator
MDSQEMTITVGGHPACPRHVRFPAPPGPRLVHDRIAMQHDPRHLPPVGLCGRGIEQAHIGDMMGVVVGRQPIDGRRLVIDIGVEFRRGGHDNLAFMPVVKIKIVENTPWSNTLQGAGLARMEIRDILAANLKQHRRERGISQEELADLAAIDRTYISALERRRYAASIEVVDRLARALGIKAADLLREN